MSQLVFIAFNRMQAIAMCESMRLFPSQAIIITNSRDLPKRLNGIENPIVMFLKEWNQGPGWVDAPPKFVYTYVELRRGTSWHQHVR